MTDGAAKTAVEWESDYDEPVRPRDLPPLDAEADWLDDESPVEILDRLAPEGYQRGLEVRCWSRGEPEWWWYILPVGDDLYAAYNPDNGAWEWSDREDLLAFLERKDETLSTVCDVAEVPIEWMPLWGDGALHAEVRA